LLLQWVMLRTEEHLLPILQLQLSLSKKRRKKSLVRKRIPRRAQILKKKQKMKTIQKRQVQVNLQTVMKVRKAPHNLPAMNQKARHHKIKVKVPEINLLNLSQKKIQVLLLKKSKIKELKMSLPHKKRQLMS